MLLRPARLAWLAWFAAATVLAWLLVATTTFPLCAVAAPDAPPPTPPSRVEARSADLLAVGIVHDDQMAIHLSRLLDNAPVHDAVITVLLRGTLHPTIAEADGSYTLKTKDLALPGAVALVFQVAQGDAHENLDGTLQITSIPAKTEDQNGARQMGWWVLNFAVCIGFLMLLSRRRKAAAAAGD